MTTRLQSEILALLSDPDLLVEKSKPVDEVSSELYLHVSAVLLESIKKAQEANKLEFIAEDNVFADACLIPFLSTEVIKFLLSLHRLCSMQQRAIP
jgi:hypothetical protein